MHLVHAFEWAHLYSSCFAQISHPSVASHLLEKSLKCVTPWPPLYHMSCGIIASRGRYRIQTYSQKQEATSFEPA